jgi:hypothetical protein
MKGNTVKNLIATLSLALCLLVLATSASAQQTLNFSNLPLVSSPTPMPTGYGQLTWGNFFYVNPWSWSGSGPGYKLGAQNDDVAFVGGEFCRISGGNTCFGTLTDSLGFELLSANVAGGYGPAAITATAYNNGVYVGAMNFFVGTQTETVNFPASWGTITELSLQVTGETGDLVVYSLSLYTLGG